MTRTISTDMEALSVTPHWNECFIAYHLNSLLLWWIRSQILHLGQSLILVQCHNFNQNVYIVFMFKITLVWSFIYVKWQPLRAKCSICGFIYDTETKWLLCIMRLPHSGVLQNMKYNGVEEVRLIFQGCDYLTGARSLHLPDVWQYQWLYSFFAIITRRFYCRGKDRRFLCWKKMKLAI